MTRSRLLFVSIVILPLFGGTLFAIDAEPQPQTNFSEMSIEELLEVKVVTASKKEEKISEAPAVVTVITSEEIKSFGANTFYDVLQRMPSIQPIGTHLYPRNAAVMRGDLVGPYDNHILILINGRPFRDDISGGLNASLYNSFPVEIIDRIEFVHGPGSVLYGTDAFDGVINIITKKPVKNDAETSVSLGAGSFGATIGKGTFQYKKNDLSLMTNINYFKDDGWDYKAITYFPAASLSVNGSTKYSNNNLSGSVFVQYKDFTLNCFLSKITQGDLGLTPAWQITGTDGKAWLTTYRRFADIGYAKELPEGYKLQLNVTYNYLIFEDYGMSALTSSEGASDILSEASFSGTIVDKINFIVGGVVTTSQNEPVTLAKIPTFYKRYYSGYAQLDYKPVDKLKLVAGTQYNKPEDIDGVIVPRFGAVYQFSDKFGTKLSYAEAFRSAWPVETLTNFPGVLVGNASLAPEKVKTTDIQAFFNTSKSQSSLTFFDNRYNNLITRIPHPTIPNTSSYTNGGTMEIQGMEIESKISLASHLYFEGSGTYQSEKDKKVLSPDYMIKGGVSYRSSYGLAIGIFDNYFGEPKKNAGVVKNPEAKDVHLVSVNLTYSVPTIKSLEINVFVQNVLDQNYYYPEFSKNWVNTLPLEPGRAVYGTVTYTF